MIKNFIPFIILFHLCSCQKEGTISNSNCKTIGYQINTLGQSSAELKTYDFETGNYQNLMSISNPKFVNSQGCFDYNKNIYYTLTSNFGGPFNTARVYAIDIANKTIDSFDIEKGFRKMVSLTYSSLTGNHYVIAAPSTASGTEIVEFNLENIPFAFPKYSKRIQNIPIAYISDNQLHKVSSTHHATKPILYYALDSNIFEVNLQNKAVKLLKTELGNVYGLRFNLNDNSLYYVFEDDILNKTFIGKLELNSETVSKISSLEFNIQDSSYSATIDVCKNEYQLFSGYQDKVLVNLNTRTAKSISNPSELFQGMFWTKLKQ